jgi:hypothetical protein
MVSVKSNTACKKTICFSCTQHTSLAMAADIPTAPPALPDNQPGPSQPVPPSTLQALASIEDTPTVKVGEGKYAAEKADW